MVFTEFPTPGVNTTVSYSTYRPNTESIVTGGTRAFKGVTGEMVGLALPLIPDDYSGAFSFSYANGFKPVC